MPASTSIHAIRALRDGYGGTTRNPRAIPAARRPIGTDETTCNDGIPK